MSEQPTPPQFETLVVRLDDTGRIGSITLDRASKLNAMSPTMLRELAHAAHWFDDRTDASVVVVNGAGRAFCAGFDLDAFREPLAADEGRDTADLGRRMADAIADMRAITVAALHGHCIGGGLVLAASCDLRVADTTTRFAIPEVDLGIPLAWGGIPRLVRELGPALTKDLVLTCRTFDAAEARSIGFVTQVVDAGDALTSANALAVSLADKSPLVLSLTKRHVNAVAEQMGSTALSFFDADVLGGAQRDPASRAAARRAIERRRR